MTAGMTAMQAQRLFQSRNAIMYVIFAAASSLLLLAFMQRSGGHAPSTGVVHAHTPIGETVAEPGVPNWKEHQALQMLTHVPNNTDVPINDPYDGYMWWSESKLRILTACLARGDCDPNRTKIAIFSTFHCKWGYFDGYHGGEGVWCVGMIRALERQGYTVLIAGDNNWRYMYQLYRQFGDLIKVIVSEDGDADRHGTFLQYVRRPDFLQGIPAWKYFAMAYYPSGWSTIVGKPWIVCAEPYVDGIWNVTVKDDGIAWISTGAQEFHIRNDVEQSTFTYLGYDMYPDHKDITIVPWEDRPYRVWLMGKYSHYFHNGDQQVWPVDFFERAYDILKDEFPGFEFVGGFQDERSDEDKEKWGPMPPTVVHNYGKLSPQEFDDAFSHARLMMGLGAPTLSPSPYRALAYGVPFANPHKLKEDDPNSHNEDDKSWGFVQHNSLNRVPEPYVYQAQGNNFTSFLNVIRRAMNSGGIQPCRFERMSHSVTNRRLSDFVNHDWKAEARKVLDWRTEGIKRQGGASGDFIL